MARLNPPARFLGRENAVFSGCVWSRRHVVSDFVGPLSIKIVLRGEAVWETDQGRYRVNPSHSLVLNHGQKYTLLIEPGAPVETLCAFFKADFVEDVGRGQVEADEALLDDPEKPAPAVSFFETLRPTPVRARLNLLRLRERLAAGEVDPLGFEEAFTRLAIDLLDSEGALKRRADSLPAARASTRLEALRRLSRARDFIEARLGQPLTLERIARSACLAPHHCHRLFAALFGETPHAYLTRRRLERARELLTTTDRPVTRVCLDVGFSSPGSFTNLFRRRFGLSPRAYRTLEKRKIR
jgi:AraC-like DNA-binding protein